MNERVLILRDAIVKITQMLAGKSIAVTQRGINAYVKADRDGRPVHVNLPYLPDNATEELCLAIQGFLDHEVAHILFSDFTLIESAVKAGPGVKSMMNILEDARIEKAMAEKFQGCGHNIALMGEFFLDKYITSEMQKAAAAGNAAAVQAVLMVPLIRGMAGQFAYKDYMKDKMHIVQEVYDQIADLAPTIEAAKSTQDCLDIAKEIEGRLRSGSSGAGGASNPGSGGADEGEGTAVTNLKGKKKPEDEEKKEEKPKKAKTKGGSKEEEKQPPAEDPEAESKGGSDEEEGEEETPAEEEAASPPGEEGEEAPSEEEEPSPAPTEEEKEEGEEEEAPAPTSSEEEEVAGEEEREAKSDGAEGEDMTTGNCAPVWEELDKDGANDFDSAMSNMISNAAADAAKDAPYLIYTNEGDTIEPLHVGGSYESRMLTELADKVDHMVGPLQKDLERAIAARSLATWESGRRSGRLHPANLSRLAVGDARVFRKRHETTSKDVACSLVVDASGSMSGSKVHLATQAAYALSQVLERIGINHEVVCFTTGSPAVDSSTLMAEASKIGRQFTRVESLYMPILKGFNERLKTEVKERFGWLPNSRILRNNVDGECIEIAARRLMARREAGKVMMVLSDGAPNASGDTAALRSHLKKVVKDITKAGIKTVGIGIQTSEVQTYYPKNVVIHDVNELPDRVIKELRHLLIS